MKVTIIFFYIYQEISVKQPLINSQKHRDEWQPNVKLIWWTRSQQNVRNAKFVVIAVLDQVNWKFPFESTQEENHSSALSVATNIGMHILWSNMQLHTGEKQLSCKSCDYRTIYTSRLEEHVNSVHSNIKPFKCEFWSYETTRCDTLRKLIFLCFKGILKNAHACSCWRMPI